MACDSDYAYTFPDVTVMLQLDIITRTMSILDHRLTLTEDRLSGLVAHQRGLSSVQAHTVSSHRQQQVAPASYSYGEDDEESYGEEGEGASSGEDGGAASEGDECESDGFSSEN
jgi:hypothetical protein